MNLSLYSDQQQGHAEIFGFERANDLFGQWADNTDEMTEKYYGSRHSRYFFFEKLIFFIESFYAGLWTNAPKESDMEVPNFPFKEPIPSYVPSLKIKQYLDDYVQKFDLKKFFQTSTNVEKVSFDEKSEKFSVSFRNFGENKSFEDKFGRGFRLRFLILTFNPHAIGVFQSCTLYN